MTRTRTAAPSKRAPILMALGLVTLGAGAARAQTVVQIPLPGVLDGRSVTTVTGGNLVVWTVPTDGGGTDTGDGIQNAFATDAVAKLKNAPAGHTLPDDGHFAANARHPEVVLNFSNTADATSPQAHIVKPKNGTFTFAVPPAVYSKFFMFFSGADNGTTVKVTMTFSDASTQVFNATIPDYFAGAPANSTVVFNLATDLAKWSKTTTIAEAGGHTITGAEFDPTGDQTLTNIQVDRGANGFLLFWGATGVATGAVAGLPDAGADTGAPSLDAGPADAGGGAGATGTSGAAGVGAAGDAGGAAGTGGQTTGAAGTSGAAGATASGAAGTGATTSGAAGSGTFVTHTGGGSGCSISGATPTTRAPWLALVAVGLWVGRRRRHR
jgi:MYXO-CTERM domain-containing protein